MSFRQRAEKPHFKKGARDTSFTKCRHITKKCWISSIYEMLPRFLIFIRLILEALELSIMDVFMNMI